MKQSGAVVWDNHACLPLHDTERLVDGIARYRAAGVTAVTINIGDSQVPLEVLIRTAAGIRHYVQQHPDDYLLGLTTADLREAAQSGRLAVCLDVEGVFALGTQVSLVEFLYQIGVRWMLLVYNRRNLAGSGCHDAEDEGLTVHGRAILAEMDRVGMIKCCSHTGYRTARESLDATDRPVIFSHSNPRRPDRTTFVGFEGGGGIQTSAEYCAAQIWPNNPPNDRTSPLSAGNIQIRP
jgi:membrane dipeptidase